MDFLRGELDVARQNGHFKYVAELQQNIVDHIFIDHQQPEQNLNNDDVGDWLNGWAYYGEDEGYESASG